MNNSKYQSALYCKQPQHQMCAPVINCRLTNYELLHWLVETQSCDVGHNRMLHSWACDLAMCTWCTMQRFVNVAWLFRKLAENENRTNTSNLRWVYWANARMRMYSHDIQSINELFIADRNTNLMLQALAETVKSATWWMTMPNATYSTTDAVPTILTILQRC